MSPVLKPLDPLPREALPWLSVGEKVAFPDVITDEAYAALRATPEFQGTAEARHPKHRLAGMYGRVEAIGIGGGKIQLDVTVIDPATGQPVAETLERVTLEEIQ